MAPTQIDPKTKAGNEFAIARAEAINTYADLERSLAALFDTLLRSDFRNQHGDSRKSYIVFSALGNYRTRRETLSQLMTAAYADKYKTFFDSLLDQIGKIEKTRNVCLKHGCSVSDFEGKTTWQEIFQREVRYPPPSDHPLHQRHKRPEDQPQSSPG